MSEKEVNREELLISGFSSGATVSHGKMLALMPLIGIGFIWFLAPVVALTNIFPIILYGVAALMFLTTAILAMHEVKGLRQLHPHAPLSSPVGWFLMLLFCWPVSFPAYMFHRRKYGLTNLLSSGFALSAVFTGSFLFYMIEFCL